VRWLATAPAIVAEALVGVPDALLTALRPGPPVSAAAVAGVLARSLSPPEYPTEPPGWLLPDQVSSFRRVLAAIHRHRGALLADPVGSGKTFVALAVATAVNHGPTACLVPATLLPQWQATAARLSVPVKLCSHEQVSRGKLPGDSRGLVVIDESHHFRNPHTRRYRHLAPWLVGRSALLVTATPIVNRVADLGHQLLLTVRDDALTLDGIASLRAMLASGCPGPALGQLVFENETGHDQRPRRILTTSKPVRMDPAATRTLDLLSRLRLSKYEQISGLIRGVLLRAFASSPAAFEGALRRYRRLLLHARDAFQAGHSIDRAELRHFTGELSDQLVWWELLPATNARSEIELGDLSELELLVIQAEREGSKEDGKLSRLRALLTDGTPTLVFTVSRDTVRYLRDHLADLRIAWCTGYQAGIGTTPLSRRAVLAWFREPTSSAIAPRHLIVTDVAAEGLDLQRAARVVHYDLPWTPMRVEQREGRSVRLGSRHAQVEVVRFMLPPVLEGRLRLQASLARKVNLPAAAGLGPAGRHIWRWRGELAERFRGLAPEHGVAAVISPARGILAGFALYRRGDLQPLSVTVLWLEPDGRWNEAPETIEAKLAEAAAQNEVSPVERDSLEDWLSLLAKPIRQRLSFMQSRRWVIPNPDLDARRAIERLQALIQNAARTHQAKRLTELERALAFVAGGHTAGEAGLVERLANAAKSELEALVRRLPARGVDGDGVEVRLTGLAVFGPAKAAIAKLASPECASSKPPSSISMEL
jgi:superfamily II DNA or RNA helicase